MAYEKQNFVDGLPLSAEQLNHMERGIADLEKKITDTIPERTSGGYYTPSVNQLDSTTMEVLFSPSAEGMPEVEAVRITLPPGPAGKSPEKGVDYWTDADQESIIQQVISALGTPVFGTVDENNNIILTGALAEGTYTLKYEDADGNVTIIGTFDSSGGGSGDDPVSGYTNQIPISTDTDGSIYNGTGYQEDKRMGSDGNEGTLSNPSAANAPFITGFIPCKQGDVIRLKNCYIPTASSSGTMDSDTNEYGNGFWGLRSGLYNASKTKVAVFSWGDLYDKKTDVLSGYTAVSNKITQFTVATSGVSFIRLALAATGSPADAVVTVNEEIN